MQDLKIPGDRGDNKNLNRYKDQTKLLLNELIAAENEISNLKQILNAASDAVLITTPDANIIYVNPAWEKLTGYTFSEVEGKNPRFLKSGKTPKIIYKKLWSHLDRNLPFSHEELINKRKDGTEFSAHSTTFPVTESNTTLYYVQFLFDISKQKEIESQRQQLLSLISHELKTPITVLKLLVSRLFGPKKHDLTQKDWHIINHELDRLNQLIDETMEVSRITRGKLNFQVSIFNLNKLIDEVIEEVSLVARNRKIRFVTLPALEVIADEKRIRQVLINLLTNAVKFSPESTVINIEGSLKKNNVVVSVQDEGLGIPKKNQSLIFDLSYQVEKKSSEGLGLGLYISSQIIKKHHGSLWVKSELGKGSTFYFSLPLVKVKEA